MVRGALLLATSLMATSHAFGQTACVTPVAPDMSRSGAQMSVDEYNKLTEGLIGYDQEIKTYRACLDAIITAPQSYPRATFDAALDGYNEASREQSALYERYDQISRDFQIMQASRASQAAREAEAASVAKSQAQLAEELAQLQNR